MTPDNSEKRALEASVCKLGGCRRAYSNEIFPFCTSAHWYAWRKANRAVGLCACGEPPTVGYRTCQPCRAYNKTYMRRWRRDARRDRLKAAATDGVIIISGGSQ